MNRPSVDRFEIQGEMDEVREEMMTNPTFRDVVHRHKQLVECEIGQSLIRFNREYAYMLLREAGAFDTLFSERWEEITKQLDERKRIDLERREQFHAWLQKSQQESRKHEEQVRQEFESRRGLPLDDFPSRFVIDEITGKHNTELTKKRTPKKTTTPKRRTFMCDFETTVYDGQTSTEVWASALSELFSGTDDVTIFHSLPETFEYLKSLNESLVLYYHNLKFDGWFWIHYLLKELEYKPSLDESAGDPLLVKWHKNYLMPNNTFKCAISGTGTWYSITIKTGGKTIEILDSYKLLPFSVKSIGKSFKTRHKKLDMVYTGYRYAGCEITDAERHYIANDVLVVKEALEFMFNEGHSLLTIGACCLSEFKNTHEDEEYRSFFPNLNELELDEDIFGSPNIDAYVRKSYRGGWCYLVKGKEKRVFHNGTTADVNSLYPSMMSSESGNYYPIGVPEFVVPDCADDAKDVIKDLDKLEKQKRYYFVRIKTRFYLRDGKLPFIQIKNNLRYLANQCLETSDYYNRRTAKYYTHYWDVGDSRDTKVLRDTRHEFTMTMTDFKLFREHYHLVDFEILDYCFFETKIGIFDDYIMCYKELKQTSEGAMRELAKLFLNNLYGKMASSTNSNFKIPWLKPDNTVTFKQIDANDKKPGYIPCGSAITSYARNFTIRAAQMNYHGVDEPGFIYADTDSIHCDLPPHQIRGITVHKTEFCCWKLECNWDVAWFTRQKTYIEHVTHKDMKPVDEPYYDIKCAGMPERCKDLFIKSMTRYKPTKDDVFTESELSVINRQYNLEDFTVGLCLPGKLMPKRVPGGILLVDSWYEMR